MTEKTAKVNQATGEISELRPSDEQLAALDSLESVRDLMGPEGTDAADLGSGFSLLDDKDKSRLVGIPLMFLFWETRNGDFGDFTSAHVVTLASDGRITGKYIVNDGSTGMNVQLQELAKKGKGKNLFSKHGLRKSEYTYTDDAGKESPASTFYIDTSA